MNIPKKTETNPNSEQNIPAAPGGAGSSISKTNIPKPIDPSKSKTEKEINAPVDHIFP